MSNQEDVMGNMFDKIMKAMETPGCRMISSVIMSGYLCSGEKKLTSPSNDLALEFLQNPPKNVTEHIAKAIKANLVLWVADSQARDEIFADEKSFKELMPIIASGGMQWFNLVKDKVITEQEFNSLFEYLKKGFISCAGETGKSHEKYQEILDALDAVIAANNGDVQNQEGNDMDILGKLLGEAASYAIVNIYGGETLIPIMATYLDDGTIKFDRILGADFEKERMFEKGYTGDLNSAIEHGLNLMEKNPDNASYNALILEREVKTGSGAMDSLYCVGVKYGESPAQVDVIFPYQKKREGKEFELFMPNPFHLDPEDLNVDTVMNGFLSGLKRDVEGWDILQVHFNNGLHPAMQQ